MKLGEYHMLRMMHLDKTDSNSSMMKNNLETTMMINHIETQPMKIEICNHLIHLDSEDLITGTLSNRRLTLMQLQQ